MTMAVLTGAAAVAFTFGLATVALGLVVLILVRARRRGAVGAAATMPLRTDDRLLREMGVRWWMFAIMAVPSLFILVIIWIIFHWVAVAAALTYISPAMVVLVQRRRSHVRGPR